MITTLLLLKKHIEKTLLLLFLSLLFVQCNSTGDNPSNQNTITRTEEQTLPEDFLAFYDKFHSDSAYQMNHIVWPLRGIPKITNQPIKELENFHWKKKNWKLNVKPDPADTNYIIRYDLFTKNVVTEHILIKNTDLRMMRRFARSNDGEWFMIYFTELNNFNGGTGAE